MKLTEEVNRENITDETEVVGDGYAISYAEVDYGPFTIEYHRASEKAYGPDENERLTVRGPFVTKDITADEVIGIETKEEWYERIGDEIDSWDYVELGEEEKFTLD